MQEYQTLFIENAIANGILKFGSFTLKSGRQSPYFFNAGLFNRSDSIAALGEAYAHHLLNDSRINLTDNTVLFGPAYKGIPLVTATAIGLANQYQKSIGYSFNRKEAKDHGEGGVIVGAELEGKNVIIIDDVITAGTAIRESVDIINTAGGKVGGILIAIDRQEIGTGQLSATQEIEQQLQVPVDSIIKLTHILAYLRQHPDINMNHLEQMLAYIEQYGTIEIKQKCYS